MAKKWVSTTDMYKAKARDRRKRLGMTSSKRKKSAPAGCLISLTPILFFIAILIMFLL